MKKFRLIMAAFSVLLSFVPGLVGVNSAFAASTPSGPGAVVCTTLGSNASCQKKPPNGLDLDTVLKAIIDLLSIVVGIVAVIVIIVAGIRLVSSGGDSNTISGARNTIIYALVGLVVVAAAQIIVQFVLGRVTK